MKSLCGWAEGVRRGPSGPDGITRGQGDMGSLPATPGTDPPVSAGSGHPNTRHVPSACPCCATASSSPTRQLQIGED